MSENEIHVGDVGTRFLMVIKDTHQIIDISTATTKSMIFTKPGGSKLTKTASFVTGGTDGQIYYISTAGDLDTAGTWQLQAYIVMPVGTWYSDISTFTVWADL